MASPNLPVAGERSLELRAYYGVPILQKSFFWDGNGEEDEAGIRARRMWHLTDDVAIGAGLSASAWLQDGPDAFAAEAEAVARYYFYRSDRGGIFAEATGGWLQSTRPVPVEGTEWNMTFSGGTGVQVPLEENIDLLGGITYHHVSNALGRNNPRNPSQNEAQLWFGVSFRL